MRKPRAAGVDDRMLIVILLTMTRRIPTGGFDDDVCKSVYFMTHLRYAYGGAITNTMSYCMCRMSCVLRLWDVACAPGHAHYIYVV